MDSSRVYWNYVWPAIEAARKQAPEIQLQINREARKKDEIRRREDALLYQIKAHPRTRTRYLECRRLLHQYYTQKKPKKMSEKEWEKTRLHYGPIISQMKRILREQNQVYVDKVELVKVKDHIYFKAYSPKDAGGGG